MVRLKQRYILFEILYPPTEGDAQFSNSPRDSLLGLHQKSPGSVNHKSLQKNIRKAIQDNYGDHGVGTAGMLLQIKYFSNKTSTGIIKCGRLASPIIVGALTLIDNFEGESVLVKVSHVSGTIKKCEQYSIKKSRELMRLLRKDKKNDTQDKNDKDEIDFVDDFGNINDLDLEDDD